MSSATAAVLTGAAMGLHFATAAAAGIDPGLARCAAIAASEARLACYDALSGRTAAERAPAHSVTAQLAATQPAASLPAAAVPPVAVLPAAAQPAATPGDAASDIAKFGLSAAQLHIADQGPQSIQAHITEVYEDRNRRGYLVLDNGQAWALTEGEMLLNQGELVTISRAALGSFMLTSASHHSYHVRRVR